ncbi:MAG: glycosyltransferase family 39 protein [Xanthobacteraceae bacterium]|nr:glycosyltransferase family 39 protein [Xanthobacteraceae bacterium]
MTTAATNKDQGGFRAGGLTAVVDYAVASHARAAAVLVLAALLAFLPGFFQIPPMDRDEARFAQATKQMLETGEYVDIRFQDEVRYKKPVGIYWLQVATVKAAEALGVPRAQTTIAIYRIPSLLGAIGAVLLTYWTALAFVSRRASLLAGLMMATSIMLGVEARLAKTDAMLLLTAVAAMGAMARAYLGERRQAAGLAGWTLPAIFWTALAAGILIKGPLILMFVGLCVAALAACDRSVRWIAALRPVPGVLWLCLLVLPWFFAIVGHSGWSFFAQSVVQDLMSKVISAQEAHGAPPGYYFTLFWVTFWPGATLAAMAVPSVWAARREKGARFLLCWIVPAWIVLELVITKLPHYVLPLYPAVAILIAGVVDPHVLARERWLVRGTGWWFFLPVIVGIGAIVLLVVFGRQLGLFAWPFAAGAMIFGLWAWRLYAADGAEHSLMRAMVASILIAVAIYAVILPSMTTAFPSAALARIVHGADCKPPLVATAGYQEPSLVFLAGTETKMVDGADAAEFLRPGGCRFALVESRHERSFLRRADAIGLRYAQPQRFEGFNYSVGRAVSIAVYRAEGAP